LHIVSDSKYTIKGLTEHLLSWEDKGWIGVANETVLREAAAELRARSAPTTFRWVKGHAGIRGNEEADKLAAQGAKEPRPMLPINLPPKKKFLHPGAALAGMTQKLAYKGIRKWRGEHVRETTQKNLRQVREEVKQLTGTESRTEAVWKALRRDPIPRKIRDFLWKALHGAHRVGEYWNHIPGYEQRGLCAKCGTHETMEHILTKCTAPGQEIAWKLAKETLEKRGVKLQTINLGIALGGTYTEPKPPTRNLTPG
ncbi:hypothetical protein C8Q78DRAFT_1090248, partial [Trametes maxima]